ncbi:RNA-directed DNA polymerase, eukaryota, reverse transcriptase zinc-binding domain protein [Tanacetum coccineum]|uniref:RNA-directed DNA polymerase, eukaryota, reverse transcriptase zinc-binding domain protein n=1 Tax=Tanacetum coccineum TaxID=301880 RepID=A0ABQ4XWK9_9ASTR
MLWSYLNHMIDSWSGEIIIMGDFNEVRFKEEHFGSIFNNHNASVFNSFISSGGLVEVPLGGCEFTWCHQSDSKMSKLDRFLISEGLMGFCPNISAITLDRYLSDHRPILLRTSQNDPRQLKNEFLSHFKERFDSPNSSRLMLDMDFPNRVSVEQVMDLERNVSKEEIKWAVWDCGSDKSPGPDGFTFGFYRRHWDTIKNDVVDTVSYFFNVGMFPKGGNASFIALIPKMQDARVVKDFRPISLIGSVYKIIAKILANRLVGVLGDLIHEVQSAFIANRQILDGPFILDELIHWCRSKNKQAMIFKVNFEKAYDSVRWDYLNDVLNKYGFGSKWRKWIRNCLVSSKGSILVNGSPTSEFYFRKGLKQGDLLSLFLFLLIMESLHLSFQNVVNTDMFKGISFKWNKVLMSKDKGGLGVSSLFALNRALLFKWVWRFHDNRNALWSRFIRALHGNCGGLDKRSKAAHTSVWKSITTEVNSLRNKGVDLLKFMNEKVGNGIDTSFWEEIWRGDMNFKTKFPRVYALESDKKITVASKMNHNDVGLSLRRAPRDGVELEQFNNLNVFLAGTMLSDSNDRWSWSLVGSGKFLVASVRKLIDAQTELGGSSYKTRWIHMVPIKINILAWKVRYDFLPTRLNLLRRGRLLLGGSFFMWSLIRMKVGWSGFYRLE